MTSKESHFHAGRRRQKPLRKFLFVVQNPELALGSLLMTLNRYVSEVQDKKQLVRKVLLPSAQNSSCLIWPNLTYKILYNVPQFLLLTLNMCLFAGRMHFQMVSIYVNIDKINNSFSNLNKTTCNDNFSKPKTMPWRSRQDQITTKYSIGFRFYLKCFFTFTN